jgi:hypothetical protein
VAGLLLIQIAEFGYDEGKYVEQDLATGDSAERLYNQSVLFRRAKM